MFKKLLALVAAMYMAVSFAAVDVNKANVAELDGIKGIGPSISSKIVEERKKGSFKDWNDFIQRVKGIGPSNAAKFSAAGMTIDGADYKGAKATSTSTSTSTSTATKKDTKSVAKTDEKTPDAKAVAAKPAASAAKK